MEEKISQNGTDEAQDKKSAKKAAKHDGGVADLERVTDYAEEKELSSADISNVRTIDNNLNSAQSSLVVCFSPYLLSILNILSIAILQAINIFGDKRNKEAAEKLAKEQELQKIHVKKEDIEVIVSVNWLVVLILTFDRIFISNNVSSMIYSVPQVNELLIPRQQAEKVLREHRGDVVNALIALTN